MPALAIVGCGGSSHAAGPAAASVNGAAAGGAGTTATTEGAGTVGASTSTTQSGTISANGGQGQGNGAGAGALAPGGGTVKNGPNNPAGSSGTGGGSTSSGGASSGKPSAHSKPKAAGGAGGHAGGAGTGGGSGSSGTGSAGSAGGGSGSAANPNSGVPFEVTTGSMEPTFQPETKIYYDPTRTHPQIGEVVVFYLPAGAEEGACGEVMVGGRPCRDPVPGETQSKLTSFKRVVGLPGDSIAIRAGHVIRNGQSEPEPPTLPCEKVERTACEYPTAITVPAGHYYLMADSRGLQKEDSRIFGAVPQEYILGTVVGH